MKYKREIEKNSLDKQCNKLYLNPVNIRAKLLLILVSIILCLGILLMTEIALRLFTNIRFLGHSRNLFIENAYGQSIGNAKLSTAISFGTIVYTDEYGFRVPKDFKKIKRDYTSTILFLGDSIGFGCGVDEDKTFCGLLRINFRSVGIYNSSVIGYSTQDYKNVVEEFIPNHKEVERVYCIFCLNDIGSESAENIKESFKNRNIDATKERIKKINLIMKVNEFLRSRSKLYLVIKNTITDPQKRYWEADLRLYTENNDVNFFSTMEPIAYINKFLKQNNISFTVIVIPYEFQLRNNIASTKKPQKKLTDFFKKEGIHYIDVVKNFQDSGIPPKELYLPYDPMHLSEKGHKIIYEIVKENL